MTCISVGGAVTNNHIYYRQFNKNNALGNIESLQFGAITGVCLMSGPFAFDPEVHANDKWKIGPICYSIEDAFHLEACVECSGNFGLWYPNASDYAKIKEQKIFKEKMKEWKAQYGKRLILTQKNGINAALSIQQPCNKAILIRVKTAENRTTVLFRLEKKKDKVIKPKVSVCRFCIVDDAHRVHCEYWGHGGKVRMQRFSKFDVYLWFGYEETQVCEYKVKESWIGELNLMNELVEWDPHIGGFCIMTQIRKPFVETKDWKKGEYINQNAFQYDEEGVEAIFAEFGARSWFLLNELNAKLSEFVTKYVSCSENINEAAVPQYLFFEKKSGIFDLKEQKFKKMHLGMKIGEEHHKRTMAEKLERLKVYEESWHYEMTVGELKEQKNALSAKLRCIQKYFEEEAKKRQQNGIWNLIME